MDSKAIERAMRKRMPDMSNVKPPTQHAVYRMVKNLRMAGTVKKQ